MLQLDPTAATAPKADLLAQTRLIGADRLYAVAAGGGSGNVPARDTVVLVDDDTTSWLSWNAYAGQLASDTGARAIRISDGGVTGPAFFDHVRRIGRPVINSPKGQTARLPPGLVKRPVVAPEIYWTWSLVWRVGEARPAVLAVVDALCDGVASRRSGDLPRCPILRAASNRRMTSGWDQRTATGLEHRLSG